MNMQKLTVTIGVPAFNEGQNMRFLLRSLLKQTETNFIVQKIIIVSDASTDNTNEIISNTKDSRVQLIINKVREGQMKSQNKIFSLANSDVVILFEADTCPKDEKFLSELIKPLLLNNKIGLIQGNPQPLLPTSFFEKILYAQDAAFYKFAIKLDHLEELFISGGAGRVFTKKVYKRLVWPTNVPEDIYAFFWLKKNKIKMTFQPDAICLYRLPQTFRDYLIKKQKVRAGQTTLNNYFTLNHLSRPNFMSKQFLFKITIHFFLTRPILFFGYLIIKIMEKIKIKNEKFTDYWKYPKSTKLLFKLRS